MKKIKLRKPRRRRGRSRGVRRRPINVLASVLTTMGLYCGIYSIFSAIDENYTRACVLIIFAIFFDMLDGTVAKLTKSVSEFGKELDSLCDLVSFGVAPAVLIYTAFLAGEREGASLGVKTGGVMAIVYVISGALRLARYNVYQSQSREFFAGLPIPAAAATIASFVLFTQHLNLGVAPWALSALSLTLAYLMVSTLRYPKDKMKAVVLAPRHAFRTLVAVGVAMGVLHAAVQYTPAVVLFPLAVIYCSYGVADGIYRWAQKPTEKTKTTGQESSDAPSPDSGDTASEPSSGETDSTPPAPANTGDLL
ncbi:MAG: CDP-diacylglycerol--serine O-phosphatidyltransferase [bacterium]|nr:CDP-diacylglycerol--serine O-phosphatidyltransferase [bacterium]